ncbi:MAG: radical SAM protein [Acidobacteriota bacterium]|nr:radical SAM protein [Acidobacteriota bacterium]
MSVVPMTLHHVGVAVRSIDESLRTYVDVFGFRQVGDPIDVTAECVRVCFVEASPGVLIELVEGVGDDSPVANLIERSGPGPYHLCYRVDDLDAAIEALRKNRCRPFRRFECVAHGFKRFAFVYAADGQIFELCEPVAQPAARKYNFPTLFFEATRRCDLSCSMCMASSNDLEYVEENLPRELTTEEIDRHILDTAKEIGVKTITWSGGEFMLREDAVELVRRATAKGYASTICTNGLHVTAEKLEELNRAAGGTLVIAAGINSIENENSWTRDSDNNLALNVLELCKKLGIRRHVVVNVGCHNTATLDTTLDWLESQGIPYNRSPYTARGSGRAYWQELRITREDMEQTIHPALRKHPLGYISYTPFFLSPEVHESYSKGRKNVTVPQGPSIGCWCGTWLAVNAEGDVAPCGIVLDEMRCGNVREKTFEQIIDDSVDFQRVLDRNQLKGKCGRCRYKFTCGGCRAMALFEHGDLMAEDPTCFFEPEDESTVSEHEAQTNRMFKHFAFMIRQAERARDMADRDGVREPADLSQGRG